MNKAKVLFSLMLIASVFSAFIITSIKKEETKTIAPPAPNNNISDEFLIGALDNGWDVSYNYINSTLGFNVWHKYCDVETIDGKKYPAGWIHNGAPGDTLFTTDGSYTSQVQGVLNNINNHNMKALMHRPKLEYLCYGQRSDYRCVDVNHLEDSQLWFYSFQSPSHTGSDVPDSGHWVRKCSTMPVGSGGDSPGLVVSRLKANTEQCHTDENDNSKFRWDSQCDWLIKPRIRIDSTLADNPVNWDTKICKIIVLNQNGDTVKKTDVKVFNFINPSTGNYGGQYLEEYFFGQNDSTLTIPSGAWGNKWVYKARGNNTNEQTVENHVDIQVYWYGSCDMWIDYVRVDNDVASDLLSTNPNNTNHQTYLNWLQWEAQDIGDYGSSPLEFYIELLEFNQIPCISYVNEKLDSYSNGRHLKVMAETLWGFEFHMPRSAVGEIVTPEKINSLYFERTGSREIFVGDPYPINAAPPVGCFGTSYTQFSRIPSTLPWTTGDSVFAIPESPLEYDRWLTGLFDTVCTFYETIGYSIHDYQFPGVYLYLLKRGDGISKLRNIPLIAMVQAHQWINSNEVDREPTNEELEMMTNLAVSYGARGIMFWGFGSYYGNDCNNCRGIMKSDFTPRLTNVYGQPKLQKFQEIVGKLKTWGPTLMSFNNADRHSYIYRDETERNTLLSESYFRSFAAGKSGFPPVYCNEWDYPGEPIPPAEEGLVYDCKEYTYLQVATFKQSSVDPSYPFFMIVNRRCSPVNGNSENGRRKIKILFDVSHPEINSHDNWNIRDMGQPGGPIVASFASSYGQWITLDWFEPGEGKLFKLEPVPITGGILQGDDTISGSENFTLTDTLFTNGYNLTIEDGAHISLTDTSAIVVNGGSFTAGTISATLNPVMFNTVGKGLTFNNAEVRIYNSQFSGINNDTSYAVNIVNCPVVDIRNSDFTSGSNSYSGGINMTYYSEPTISNIYLGYNTFEAGTSTIPFVNIMSYAAISTPALIEHNTFTSTSGAMALMLSGVTGGAVKSNTFMDFARSVCALSSSIDVYGNTFTNESATSTGLEGLSGTELRLNKVSRTFIGGLNNFSNNQSSSRNILVDYSHYLLDGGENVFNIGSDNESKHLRGSFPYPVPVSTNATVNCFKIEQNVSNPFADVTSNGSPVSFVFEPYLSGCDPNGGGDEMVINLGNGIYDTISIMSGAGGNTMTNDELRMTGDKLQVTSYELRAKNDVNLNSVQTIITSHQLYDSICIQMRYRNYSYVKNRCEFMLNAYPDSIESIYAAHKLYLAVSVTDTTSSGKTALKTLFETLILNNPNNTALVKKCNYLIQKCKVLLHQYSSALAGFQQIINNNPYSYEGLVAHWDYMATSLLIQGGAGSISNFGLSIANLLSDKSDESDKSGDPNDKFTKEERKQITKTVNQSFESSKESGQKKIEMLTKQASEGNTESAKQVKQMRTLEQVVTIQKPKNLFEHINIVKSDLKRVFGNDNSSNNKNNKVIPAQFMLSQNYPNPFNPSTTIKYALPKDVKVVIRIYDILGREVQTLVNEFKKAGYYEVKFNGSNFASGVYFYRIEVRQAGSSTGEFVVSKKMVLLK